MTPRNNRRAYHSLRVPALIAVLLAVFLLPATVGAQTEPLQSPIQFFGHAMGQDRKLVSYDEFLPYLNHLAQGSDRVNLRSLGRSTQGRDLALLVISSPENLARTERFKDIAALLHNPVGMTQNEISALVGEGKTVMLVTLNIHASEIIASQTGLEWAYHLAAGTGPSVEYLDDVIVLLIPSVNPDGQVMITDWYREHLGTAFEGCSLPWLYHPYAGHDNNRDWFMLNLAETKAVNRLAFQEWFPQVVVDVHQMGHTGPRIFIPPYADPISDRVHPLVHRGTNLLGTDMALRLEQAEKSGVIYGYYFDAYWPGGMRSTPWWKNTVGVLVEVASARVASPVFIDPGELTGGQKGLVDYQPQVNFPNPWPGGWWRPRDILEYELIALDAALETCALRRVDFLFNRARMGQDDLRPVEAGEPAAYVIPVEQHDPGTAAKLVELLRENGLRVYRTRVDHEQEGHFLRAGSAVFPVNQPMRAFLHEMMSSQDFREVRTSSNGAEVLPPYDVTAWTLPLLTGVRVLAMESPVSAPLETLRGKVWPAATPEPGDRITLWALSPAYNDSYTAALRLRGPGKEVRQMMEPGRSGNESLIAGTFLCEATGTQMGDVLSGLHTLAVPLDAEAVDAEGNVAATRLLHVPRVGLYQPWTPSMDEGWTRLVFDQFEIPYVTLHNPDMMSERLSREYDVIILPDMDRASLMRGHEAWNRQAQDPRPAPYDRGLGQDGIDALRAFVDQGGVLVTLGNSANLALKDLNLPVNNEGPNPRDPDHATPGVILRAEVDPFHPLGFGMPARAAIYHTDSPVFVTELPGPGRSRTVVARYPRGGELVLSGWGKQTDRLRRKAALVEAELGAGKVVLFGFRPQFRAQTHGTYRMLFNALLDAAAEKP